MNRFLNYLWYVFLALGILSLILNSAFIFLIGAIHMIIFCVIVIYYEKKKAKRWGYALYLVFLICISFIFMT
ncbi:hypothetical protein BTR22_04515 [Alkalihalophilus pseudofirmus]|nr:hypothetical protein BTR22_04515 [Alkalihalophilus pseudofirmus]